MNSVKEEDKDFPQPQRPITLAESFPRNFHENYLKEAQEVAACHAISATEREDIPTSPSKMVIEPKDLPFVVTPSSS